MAEVPGHPERRNPGVLAGEAAAPGPWESPNPLLGKESRGRHGGDVPTWFQCQSCGQRCHAGLGSPNPGPLQSAQGGQEHPEAPWGHSPPGHCPAAPSEGLLSPSRALPSASTPAGRRCSMGPSADRAQRGGSGFGNWDLWKGRSAVSGCSHRAFPTTGAVSHQSVTTRETLVAVPAGAPAPSCPASPHRQQTEKE